MRPARGGSRPLAAIGVALAVGVLGAAAPASAQGEAAPDPGDAIRQVLEEQAAAWNRGDLDAFMEGYWRSDELIFTSGGNVQRGWRTTLDRYRESYGTSPETMGRLTFSDLEIHPLGDDAAWALGRWALAYDDGSAPGGVFTLVLRRIDAQWRIVHDHTSSHPPEGP